jgi:hypothetical protein
MWNPDVSATSSALSAACWRHHRGGPPPDPVVLGWFHKPLGHYQLPKVCDALPV